MSGPPAAAPGPGPATTPGPFDAVAEDAVIVDRGYRHWDGQRRGRRAIRWAIVVDTLRRAFGLGRRARSKLMPWGLVAIAVMLAFVVTGLYVAAGLIAGGLPPELASQLPSHAELFGWYSAIVVVFVAVVGPSMLIPDRRNGTLALALSRPLTVADWIGAKAGAFLLVVGTILVLPQLVLWIGRAAVATDLLAYTREAGPVLWQVPVVALVTAVAQGALLGLVASIANRIGIAAVAFLGTWAALGPIASELSAIDLPGFRLLALGNLAEHTSVITNQVFGLPQGTTSLRSAGFDPWVSWVVLTLVAVVSGWVVVRRHADPT